MTKYRLNDIAPIQQGEVQSAEKYWLLNLDMVESNTGKVIDYVYCDESKIGNSTVKFDTRNVLYSKLRPYLNKVVMPKKAGYATSEMLPLRPNTKIITRSYLTYFLRSPLFVAYINEKTSGAKMPRANSSDLKEYQIECPDIKEQNVITAQFDTLLSIIDKRKSELEELDILIKARFVEMFGKSEFPHVTIADLVEKKVSTVKSDFAPNDVIKYIDISSIDNKRNIMTGYTEYILSEAPSRAQQHIVKDDILISTVRPNLRNVAITSYDDNNIVASSGFCVLRAKKCLPSYLMAIACSNEFTDAMSNVVTGANYPAIKDSDVMKYMVSSPPIELQIEFEQFTKQVDKSKFAFLNCLEFPNN